MVKISIPKCNNCSSIQIKACVGADQVYLCGDCYNLFLNNKLNITKINEKKSK